ncbi:hypothetical protein ACS0TY_013866 [Phlomoides rotata]
MDGKLITVSNVGFRENSKKGCRGFYPALTLWLTDTSTQKFMSRRRNTGPCQIYCPRVADPKVVSMCHKSWPYYESWLDIFGKDRATGEHVVNPIDIVKELVRTET